MKAWRLLNFDTSAKQALRSLQYWPCCRGRESAGKAQVVHAIFVRPANRLISKDCRLWCHSTVPACSLISRQLATLILPNCSQPLRLQVLTECLLNLSQLLGLRLCDEGLGLGVMSAPTRTLLELCVSGTIPPRNAQNLRSKRKAISR